METERIVNIAELEKKLERASLLVNIQVTEALKNLNFTDQQVIAPLLEAGEILREATEFEFLLERRKIIAL